MKKCWPTWIESLMEILFEFGGNYLHLSLSFRHGVDKTLTLYAIGEVVFHQSSSMRS